MTQKHVQGVYTALLTPRRRDNSLDREALERLMAFQLEASVTGFAINGATGEFCLTTPEQLDEILTLANDSCGDRARILCGVGGASLSESISLASIAERRGVHALLLPMPYFFPYKGEDLDVFAREVAGSTSLPVLLYNLPQFTSGLDVDVVLQLIQEVPNIIGIKDSSGSLEILRAMALHTPSACRIIGNDGALAAGLREGITDGVVSGVACVLPRLMQELFAAKPSSDAFERDATALASVISQLDPFPTPWGLKWAAESLGLFPAVFAQPIAADRRVRAAELMSWFAAQNQPNASSPAAAR